MDAYAHCMEVVRSGARVRFIADLYAPADMRRHLFALHAFNVEVGHIPDIVSEPMPGEIRIQWWRDALANGESGGNPVADALLQTINRFSLPKAAFERLLEARIFDLYNDPMPSLAALEAYAGETESALLQLAAIVLAVGSDPGSADAAGHGGVALTLTRRLKVFARDAARHRFYFPADRAKAGGIDLDAIFAGNATPELAPFRAEMLSNARAHLAAARQASAGLPPVVKRAFLPLALVMPELDRLEQASDAFVAVTDIPAWRQQWILWRAARRGF